MITFLFITNLVCLAVNAWALWQHRRNASAGVDLPKLARAIRPWCVKSTLETSQDRIHTKSI